MITNQNQFHQTELSTQNNNIHNIKSCSRIALGGIILGLVTSIALGIIFGPLAAVAGFCSGGVCGACLFYCCISNSNRPEDLAIEKLAASLHARHIARQEKLRQMRNS